MPAKKHLRISAEDLYRLRLVGRFARRQALSRSVGWVRQFVKDPEDEMKRLTCWIGVLLCSCIGAKDGQDGRDRNLPANYRISLGRGGGITGGEQGCDLWPQGRVRAWRKLGPGRIDSLWSSAIAPRAVDQLRRELDALGVLAHPIREPGNMSYRVRLISPEATHYWTWTEEGVLTEWYRRAEALCQPRDDTN